MAAGTRQRWLAAYGEALEADTWGQVEEAVGHYTRLHTATETEARENKLGLPAGRRAAIAQAAAALQLRIKELNGPAAGPGGAGVGLAGMQALKPFIAGLIVSDVNLPLAVAATMKAASGSNAPVQLQQPGLSSAAVLQDSTDLIATASIGPWCRAAPAHDGASAQQQQQQQQQQDRGGALGGAAGIAAGTLRPPLEQLAAGDVTLSIRFGSWSVKGAADMEQPHVLITVRDGAGKLVDAVQTSPHVSRARCADPDKLDLDFTYHLQVPLNVLPEDAALFFELRHWKAAKTKWSVKCYTFLPYSQCLRAGAAMLELYKKPAAYKQRGRPASYTSKPMYLHLACSLEQH